ncbi:MAG TPA: hypothetical protein VGX50_09680, partial [Longimicrobium sp.]|nr:hypothetical protein [Longimicrobium sp.]
MMGSRKKAVSKVDPGGASVVLDPGLMGDIRSLIEAARSHVAQVVNSAMVLTYWGVGDRIRREVLGQ